MGSFRDYLKSKDYFEKIKKIMDKADLIISEKDEELENLTDTTDIDNDVVDAQEQAKQKKGKQDNKETDNVENSDDNDTEDTEDTEETEDTEDTDDSNDSEDANADNEETLSKANKRIENKTFKNALKSQFFKTIKHLCFKGNFKKISEGKFKTSEKSEENDNKETETQEEHYFEIPKDKKSISFSQMKPVSCGYTITFAEFENNPKVKGDVNKLNEIVLSDEKSVISLSSDYFGVSFFVRNDFVITDTNTDNYAEKLFNDIVTELKNTEKLTYECFKTAVLNKIKKDQNIGDDVLLGYMRVYNFANYISKNVIEKFYNDNEIPVIVTDNDNIMLDYLETETDSKNDK